MSSWTTIRDAFGKSIKATDSGQMQTAALSQQAGGSRRLIGSVHQRRRVHLYLAYSVAAASAASAITQSTGSPGVGAGFSEADSSELILYVTAINTTWTVLPTLKVYLQCFDPINGVYFDHPQMLLGATIGGAPGAGSNNGTGGALVNNAGASTVIGQIGVTNFGDQMRAGLAVAAGPFTAGTLNVYVKAKG